MNACKTARVSAILAIALGALALATGAGAGGSYTDTTGDGKGAPDISSVAVASDSTGQIVFTVHVDNLPDGDVQTYVDLDTDLNEATGMPGSDGAEYVLGEDQSDHTFVFGHWTGSAMDWDIASATVTVNSTANTVVFSVNRSELGNATEFNFWVGARAGQEGSGQFDDAPDSGSWNYSLQAGGPDLRGLLVQAAPASGPKPGKVFALTLSGIRVASTVVPKADSYACRARLAGKRLVGLGTTGCAWKLPANSRGKTLAVTITASYQGATASMPLTFVVSK